MDHANEPLEPIRIKPGQITKGRISIKGNVDVRPALARTDEARWAHVDKQLGALRDEIKGLKKTVSTLEERLARRGGR